MSTYSDLVTAITTQLSAVSNIGQVHSRERFTVDWAKYLEQFATTISDTQQTRGWVVTLERITTLPEAFSREERRYQFLIYGMMSLKDSAATETAFFDLIELILNTLDDETTLGVSGTVVNAVGPASMRFAQIRQFGSPIVHYCEIEYPVLVGRSV